MTSRALLPVVVLMFGGCASPAVTAEHPCHLGTGGRPDRMCTPSALNPAVSQDTIRSTICVPGWTATVRPPAAYTTALKKQQIRAYGLKDTSTTHYEEDHLVPLSLGGAPRDPLNLWPQVLAQAVIKDRDENARAVCAGTVSLATAQAQLLAKWGPTP